MAATSNIPVDHYGQYIASAYPWKSIHLQKLHKKTKRSGWAQDIETTYFIRVPYILIQTSNVLIEYEGRHMSILQGTLPDQTNFKNDRSIELLAYYPWMGS